MIPLRNILKIEFQLVNYLKRSVIFLRTEICEITEKYVRSFILYILSYNILFLYFTLNYGNQN